MNRNYNYSTVTPAWCESHETHPAVASAIHAISDSKRTPEMIWEAPTAAEFEHVGMAVAEYVQQGDIKPEPDNRYPWGQETITLHFE